VLVWTLTVLVLALRQRPAMRQFAAHPGLMACCAAVLAGLLVGPMQYLAERPNLVPGLPFLVRLEYYLGQALTFHKGEAGIAVASSWLTLALSRSWEPQPNLD
jgi:hypothetical protein